MADISRFTAIGCVGTDPEQVHFESGSTITKFSIAVNRYDKKEKKDVPDWWNVETFSKLGDYIKKGTRVAVDGRMIKHTYTNKSGDQVSIPIVQNAEIQILTPKKQNEEQTSQSDENYAEPQIDDDDFQDDLIGEDEIPF